MAHSSSNCSYLHVGVDIEGHQQIFVTYICTFKHFNDIAHNRGLAPLSPALCILRQIGGPSITSPLYFASNWWPLYHQPSVFCVKLVAPLTPALCILRQFGGPSITNHLYVASNWWPFYHQPSVFCVQLVALLSPAICILRQTGGPPAD